MQITVCVRLEGQFTNEVKCLEVPEIFEQAFRPLKVCDDKFMAVVMQQDTLEDAQLVLRMRKNAATELAKHIATALIDEMQKHDTLNGYPVEK